jgi:hypothetical protein
VLFGLTQGFVLELFAALGALARSAAHRHDGDDGDHDDAEHDQPDPVVILSRARLRDVGLTRGGLARLGRSRRLIGGCGRTVGLGVARVARVVGVVLRRSRERQGEEAQRQH